MITKRIGFADDDDDPDLERRMREMGERIAALKLDLVEQGRRVDELLRVLDDWEQHERNRDNADDA